MSEERIYAKSLKLADDEIVCPICNAVLAIPEDIMADEWLQCPKCDTAIPNNPYKDNQKFIICQYCGGATFLPVGDENVLMINCGECGETIHNTWSDKYTPIACPYCMFESYILNEHRQARYFNCTNCGERFKNPLR